MKILLVHPLGLGFGAYKYIDQLARTLAGMGDTVKVLAPHDGNDRLLNDREPAFEFIPLAFDGPFVAREVKRQVTKFAPDIVHVWTPRALPSRVGLEMMLATGAKLIVNYEDPEHYHFDTMNGPVKSAQVLRHIDKAVITPGDVEAFVRELNWHWIFNTLNDPQATAFLHPLFFALVNHAAAGFTAIWHSWERVLADRFHKPVLVLPYAVDFDNLTEPDESIAETRRKLDVPADTLLILRSGTIYAMVQDQEIMFAGYAAFIRKHPDSLLLLAGVDIDPSKTDRMIERHGLQDHVRRLGVVRGTPYANLLQAADITLCPGYPDEYNRFRLAMKIIDYMTAGKPMICYGSGIGEDLQHESDALLLSEYTPDEVCHMLSRLAMDGALRASLGRAARQRAEEWFDVRQRAATLHAFYEAMLNADKAPAKNMPCSTALHDQRDLPRALLRRLPEWLNAGIRRPAIYGAGKHTQRLLDLTRLEPMQIQCIIDDQPVETEMSGFHVIHPSQIERYEPDAILISSDAWETPMQQKAAAWAPDGIPILRLYD
jgi:glycosyltransferase involved in cell wall biosynthesis